MNTAELNRLFRSDRPLFRDNDSVTHLIERLNQELKELEEWGTPEEMMSECADIILFAMTLIEILGGEADEVVKAKLARNQSKYPAKDFREGDYQEKIKESRDRWDGDEDFK